MDVAAWLRDLGLERYVPVFLEAEITAEVLPALTEADLRELGLPLGPRKVLLKAIRALRARPRLRRVRRRRAAGIDAAARQAERRQLTVMFVDLVGSTALSARLDPEEMREVLRAYQNAVAAEVARASTATSPSSWATACWPTSAGRGRTRTTPSGRSGPAWRSRRRSPAASHRRRALAARVGIATGLVVVGDLVGEGAAQEEAVIGETPNLAARLQALAEPGAVVVAEATRRLVGGLFELDDLGPSALKGFAEPVRGLRGRRRAAGREPLRGAARGRRAHPAGRSRAGAGAAARPLAAGQGRRGAGGAARGRARHRQVAPRARAARAARGRAAHARCAIMLAVAHRQRAAPGHRASRAGGRASSRTTHPSGGSPSWRRCWPRRRRTTRWRPPCCRGLLASRPDGRYAARAHPAAAEGADLRGAAGPARGPRRRQAGRWRCSRTRTGPTPPRSSCSTAWSSACSACRCCCWSPSAPSSSRPGAARARHLAHARPARPAAGGGAGRAADRRQGTAGRGAGRRSSAKTDGVPLFVEELTKAVLEAGLLRGRGRPRRARRPAAAAGDPGHPARLR